MMLFFQVYIYIYIYILMDFVGRRSSENAVEKTHKKTAPPTAGAGVLSPKTIHVWQKLLCVVVRTLPNVIFLL